MRDLIDYVSYQLGYAAGTVGALFLCVLPLVLVWAFRRRATTWWLVMFALVGFGFFLRLTETNKDASLWFLIPGVSLLVVLKWREGRQMQQEQRNLR